MTRQLHLWAALGLVALVACSSDGKGRGTGSGSGDDDDDGDKPSFDLSDDDAVREAFEDETGDELDEKDGCIKRPRDVPNVVLIGSFAHDRGCMLRAAFVGDQFLDAKELRSEGPAHAGWKKMSSDKRKSFALPWVEQVLLGYDGTMLRETDDDFGLDDTPPFSAPEVKSHGDDVRVRGWMREPSGMMDQAVYLLMEASIAPDGEVTTRMMVSFSVPGWRTRD